MCLAGRRLGQTYSLIYRNFAPPADFYLILVVFVGLLVMVVMDEMRNGTAVMGQRKTYQSVEDPSRKKMKFDFGHSKV